MHFLNPLGWAALLLAVPILLLYMLRLHRRNVTVPSTYLWDAVLSDRHANRPWQKLRRNWLLFLQLLALLAMTLALARPAIPAPLALHGQVIVLLDGSASMQAAHSDGGTRFDVALGELRALAATFEPGDRVSLILVGATPRLLVAGGDAAAFRQALDGLAPTDGAPDWRGAATLAAGLATGDAVTTLLVTDAAGDAPIPALPGAVRLLAVGEDAPNAGIVAFALRRTGEGMAAFARVQNAGPATERTLALYVDGVLFERRALALAADGAAAVTFEGVPVTAWAEARLEGSDALPLDDVATVALSGQGSARVLLVTPGNRFLEQVLAILPDLAVEQAAGGVLPEDIGAGEYDLVVVDGLVTATLPAANLWLIAPGPGSPCGEPGDVVTPTVSTRGQWSHPLLQHVDWRQVHVARARHYTPPADADILIESATGPLVWIVEHPGQRVACFAFDLHDSDLPLRMAFPILTAHLAGWLVPQISAEPVMPLPAGLPWLPPLPAEATQATLVTPGGERVRVSVEGEPVAVSAAGLYRVEATTPAGRVTRYAALALLDAAESDLRPREVVVGGQIVPPAREDAPGWRDLSRWAAGLALALVLLEAVAWWQPRWRQPRWRLPQWNPTAWLRGLRDGAVLIRLALVTLLLLALLGAQWARRTRDLAVVFVLDRSASTRAAWDAQVAFVEEALETKADRDRAAVVVFGGDAWVDRPLSPLPELRAIATLPRADATDIEEALRLALALIPQSAPGRLVLLTDGLETTGRAAWALQEARARGVEVQVVQSGTGTPGPEVWLADVRMPSRVYPGDRVPVSVEVRGNTPQDARLTWRSGGQIGQTEVALTGAESTLVIPMIAETPGFMAARVCVEAEFDTFLQNNCADGWVLVEGTPRVLVVGEPEERAALVAALESAGLLVEGALPGDLPLTVRGLTDYAGVVLVNTPARAFSAQAMEALRAFARDVGGGLVAVGGPQSYGVGGWLGTPLETALPVEMRVQDPQRFPPLTMIIVIDTSGSMGAEEGGVTKIRLAGEAAIRVAETLNDSDILAVVTYDTRPADTLGPVQLTERDALIAQLRRLQVGGGGIYVYDSMVYAIGLFAQMAPQPGMQRHILMLADGADAEQQGGVLELTRALVDDEGITTSVVSIGDGVDVPFLIDMAAAGDGRFYLTERAVDLPGIFAEEATHAKRSYIVEESFYPTAASQWAPVSGIAATPALRGYVATAPKPAAQVVWEGTQSDPLLAVWQYGLGRAVAWTSDATGRWAADWVTWDDFARFWGGVVRDVLPAPSDGGVALWVLPEGNGARILADVTGAEGEYADGLDLQVQVAVPGDDAEPLTVALAQTAPGHYEGAFTPPEQGALLLRLHGDRNLMAGWVAPPSEEYIPGDAAVAVERLAAQGDSAVVTSPAAVFRHTLRGREAGRPLLPLLMLLAAALWPVDIAWRRLSLTRADVAQWWARLRARLAGITFTRPQAQKPEMTTLAGQLRQRQKKTPARSDVPLPASSGDSEDVSVVIQPAPEKPQARVAQAPPSAEADDQAGTLAARLKRKLRDD